MAGLKVLFATSEVVPLIKTGGLADVAGALPAALQDIGVDVRIIIPGYSQVLAKLDKLKVVASFQAQLGFPAATLLSATLVGSLPLFVIDCPELYQRDGGPYQDKNGQDWEDNALRFGLLSKITAVLGSDETPLEWRPDIVHCNDWQTGLTPAYLHFSSGGAPSIITIHNLAFQGNFSPDLLSKLNLPASCFTPDYAEFYGQLSFLKAGLSYANHITTVSPKYAKEIQENELGFGMQGVLTKRSHDLTGILNGIDINEWNSETDVWLEEYYHIRDMSGKALNKAFLQKKMHLTVDPTIPLLGVISRFTHQKGLDLLLEIVPELMQYPVQLVMLGSGETDMQQAALNLSHRFPGRFATHIGFSESLSHLIEAGADMFVMPSRFEPCGLNQMYSQRYGTPPIVHATGGLADSVVDCTDVTLKTRTASGFSFEGMNQKNLFETILRALKVYDDQTKWQALCKNCMAKDFNWKVSADAYRAVYSQVIASNKTKQFA